MKAPLVELLTLSRDGLTVERRVYADRSWEERVVGRLLPESHFEAIEARLLDAAEGERTAMKRSAHAEARRAELLGIVTMLAARLGRTPTSEEVGAVLRPNTTGSVQSGTACGVGKYYFGSYAAMIREAGCTPNRRGRQRAA